MIEIISLREVFPISREKEPSGKVVIWQDLGVSRSDPRDEQKPAWQVAERIQVIFHSKCWLDRVGRKEDYGDLFLSKFWLDPAKDFQCWKMGSKVANFDNLFLHELKCSKILHKATLTPRKSKSNQSLKKKFKKPVGGVY